MTIRAADPRRLNVKVFARDAGELAGRWPLDTMPRLRDSIHGCAPAAGVNWSARGELRAVHGAPAQVWLHLRADAAVELTCQRCLQPMLETLKVQSRIRFEADERTAAEVDAEIEDDVLVLSRELDLHQLLEDELLLALPLVPRHEGCVHPLAAAAEAAPEPPDTPRNPFHALAALRKPEPH